MINQRFKSRISFISILIIMLVITWTIEILGSDKVDRLAYRIKVVHDAANNNLPLPDYRAKEYASVIIEAADRYPHVSAELLQAVAEAESNYVNPGQFWDGADYGYGIWHMQRATAKWIWNEADYEGEFDKWAIIEPTAKGADSAAFYLNYLQVKHDHEILKALYDWKYHKVVGNEAIYDNHIIRILGIKEVINRMEIVSGSKAGG